MQMWAKYSKETFITVLAALGVAVVLGLYGLALWAHNAAADYLGSKQNASIAAVAHRSAALSFYPLVDKQQADDQNYAPETSVCDAYGSARHDLASLKPASLTFVPLGAVLTKSYAQAQSRANTVQTNYASLAGALQKVSDGCAFYIKDMRLSDAITNASAAAYAVLDSPGYSMSEIQGSSLVEYTCNSSVACVTPHSLGIYKQKWPVYQAALAAYADLFKNDACYSAGLVSYCRQAAQVNAQLQKLAQAVADSLTLQGIINAPGTNVSAYSKAVDDLHGYMDSSNKESVGILHAASSQSKGDNLEDVLLSAVRSEFVADQTAISASASKLALP